MKKILIIPCIFICTILYSQSWPGDTIGIWSSFNFETPNNDLIIDTSSQNIWQIGVPQKTLFNSGYYSENVIITDTVNFYPTNNLSFFDIRIGYFNNPIYPYDIFIDFWHKFDTDSLKDGGYITVSWDYGQSWHNIIHDSLYFGLSPQTNFYTNNLYSSTDTLFNEEYGFSGRNINWMHTSFSWAIIPVKDFIIPDTMIIRFNFISDSINNQKEGWIIDKIQLFSIDLGGNVSNKDLNNDFNVYPNPTHDYVYTTQSQNIEIISTDGRLLLKEYSDRINISNLPRGIYFVKIQNTYQKIIKN